MRDRGKQAVIGILAGVGFSGFLHLARLVLIASGVMKP